MLDKKLISYLGKTSKYDTGHIGIEVELEGSNLVNVSKLDYWNLVPEGSLRNGGVEYVTKIGCHVDNLKDYMAEFSRATEKGKTAPSIRTSVHVHVCAHQLTLLQIYAVIVTWWLLEDLLVSVNGRNRVGNLFCLRVRDAEYIHGHLLREIKERSYFKGWKNNLRYAALNLCSLEKTGTLEFRFIKGLSDAKEIELWARGLQSLVYRASALGSPRQVLRLYEELPFSQFIEHFFPTPFVSYLKGLAKTFQTDNENLASAMVIAAALEYKTPQRLRLRLQEDIDDLSDEKKKEDDDYRSPIVMAQDLITAEWVPPGVDSIDPVDFAGIVEGVASTVTPTSNLTAGTINPSVMQWTTITPNPTGSPPVPFPTTLPPVIDPVNIPEFDIDELDTNEEEF